MPLLLNIHFIHNSPIHASQNYWTLKKRLNWWHVLEMICYLFLQFSQAIKVWKGCFFTVKPQRNLCHLKVFQIITGFFWAIVYWRQHQSRNWLCIHNKFVYDWQVLDRGSIATCQKLFWELLHQTNQDLFWLTHSWNHLGQLAIKRHTFFDGFPPPGITILLGRINVETHQEGNRQEKPSVGYA